MHAYVCAGVLSRESGRVSCPNMELVGTVMAFFMAFWLHLRPIGLFCHRQVFSVGKLWLCTPKQFLLALS